MCPALLLLPLWRVLGHWWSSVLGALAEGTCPGRTVSLSPPATPPSIRKQFQAMISDENLYFINYGCALLLDSINVSHGGKD